MLNRSKSHLLAAAVALLAAAILPGGALAQATKQPTPKPPAARPTPARTPVGARPTPALRPGQTPAPGQPPRPGQPGQPGQPGAAQPGGAKPAGAASSGDTAMESVVAPLPNPALEGSNLPEPPSEEPPEDLEENAGEEEKINVLKKGQPIESILGDIKKKTGVTVLAKGEVAGQAVDLQAKEKSVREILDLLVAGKEWTWIRRQDGTFEIWDKAGYIEKEMRKRVIRKVFQLKFVPVTDLVTAIEGVKSEVGELAANPRTNELIVTDLPDKVAQIESIIKEIDTQLYTRRFGIRYAKFEDLQSRIEGLLSPAGELQADAQNRILIVTDTFYKIKQMEQLIEMLDIDQPMKIYHLIDILGSEDGGGAEDMIDKFIKPIASEDALVEFNHSQGTLLVKDVAEVHDQILEILKALDQTPKQVWIEGEILEVSKNYNFEFGTEWTFSRDLPHAITRGLADSFLPVTGGTTATPTPIGTSTFTPVPTNPPTARNELAVLTDEVYPLVTGGAAGLKVINLAGNLKAQMTAMMQDDQTRLLLQPRVLARNGQEVEFNLTQQNPQQTTFFNSGSFNNNNNFNNNFGGTSITFVETGVILNLTPTISNRGLIEMDMEFTNSTPFNAAFVTNGQANTAIGVNEQSVRTTLIVPSGETRAIGGLISHSNSDGKGGVPWLSKLPYLGWLFGKKTERQDQRNLVFFVTPTMVEEKPQVDVVDVAVNAAARALDARVGTGLSQPADLNPLPEELRPILRQIPPGQDWMLLQDADAPTTDTFELQPLGQERVVPKPKKPKKAKKKDAAEELAKEEGMLQDEPPAVEDEEAMPEEEIVTGPGSELGAEQGLAGPSGTIGEGAKPAAGGAAQPGAKPAGPKPAPTPKPVQAARPGRPNTGSTGGPAQTAPATSQPAQQVNPPQGLQNMPGGLNTGNPFGPSQPGNETQFR